jgi:hypothetical protein
LWLTANLPQNLNRLFHEDINASLSSTRGGGTPPFQFRFDRIRRSQPAVLDHAAARRSGSGQEGRGETGRADADPIQ